MSSKISDKEITEFVRKVRSELRELPADELAELTENLAADLFERRNEEGDAFNLGNASDYAGQLADAAGLRITDVEATRMNLEFLRLWKSSLGYLRTLAPAWAIIRAWLIFALVFSPFVFGGIRALPGTTMSTVVLIALVVASVWLSLKQFKVLRIPLIVLNALLLIASPILVADIGQAVQLYTKYVVYENESTLVFQGSPVRGVCSFDPLGNKSQVQKLVDVNGYDIYVSDGLPPTC